MNKARELFGSEIKKIRKQLFKNNNQERFAQKINALDLGYELDQKKVSLIETGKPINLPISFVDNLCNYFISKGYTIDDNIILEFKTVLEQIPKKQEKNLVSLLESDNLFSKPHHDNIKKYFGTYNCFFFSTDSQEPKIVDCTMTIRPNISQCEVYFEIPLKELSTTKKYKGIFFYNQYYSMWYSILVGEHHQEVCFLASQHINSTVSDNSLNVALVITTSAGTRKRPTMHRLFLSRNNLTNKQKELVLSQLKLNDDTIFISENNLTKLLSVTNERITQSNDETEIEKYRIILDCLIEIKKQPCEKYYKIDEAALYDTSTVSNNKAVLGYAISEIRKFTDNKYYNKLSDTVHEICTEILK